jgi:hypothetical protein
MTGDDGIEDGDVRTAADLLYQTDQHWEHLSDEEKRDAIGEALDFLTETGERLSWSDLTEKYYVVERWVPLGDGRIVSLSKRDATAEEAERLDKADKNQNSEEA